MKGYLKVVGLLLLVLIAIIVFNTLRFSNNIDLPQVEKVSAKANPQVLSHSLSFQTISHKAEMIDSSAFRSFHKFLDSVFPLVNSSLSKELVNNYSLIYTLEGSNKELKPLIVMAHQDVVPADYSTLNEWDHPPFSGIITEEYIYGRGALDDKGSMIAILDALENLLQKGYQPKRSIIFCFGHDEEIGGNDGAKSIVNVLKGRNVKAHMVLDEGGNMLIGIVPGIESPVALIGTSEKGYLSVELSANISGGHSSMPEQKTAVNSIAAAVYKIEQNPMPNRLSEPLEGFIECIGPELPFVQKMAFANTWLFKPIIYNVYEQSASGSALIHTTQTTTILQAGIKDNVIPKRAKAVLNMRLLPGDEPEDILHRMEEIIADTAVKIKVYEEHAVSASPVSDYKSDQFKLLSGTIKSVYPEALVSPYLVLAATDARFFYEISDHVFRFSPISLEKDDLARLHGINERVSLEDYEKSVEFYATLFQSFGNS